MFVELNVDFATGGSVKWLLGGPGAGYLYVREDLDKTMHPQATGWAAHEHPFQFAAGPIDYAPDIHRYLNGTPKRARHVLPHAVRIRDRQ